VLIRNKPIISHPKAVDNLVAHARHSLGRVPIELGFDSTGRDRVETDAGARVVHRQLPSQALHPSLRGLHPRDDRFFSSQPCVKYDGQTASGVGTE
jgi:hypothetical protein